MATADGLRPVLKLTYALCGIFGDSTVPFHLFNVLVHGANIALVARLVTLASPTPSRLATLATATLFALHPMHTEAVTYVSGRSSLLSTTFSLLAVCLYAHGIRTGRRAVVWVAAPCAFTLAVLTKETALVLPLGLLLWDVLIEHVRPRALLARQAPWWIAGTAILGFMIAHDRYFALLYRVVGQRSLRDAFAHQLGGLTYLASRLALVARPCIDPGLWAPPTARAVVMGGGVVVSLVAIAVTQRTARPLVSFGVAWFLLYTFVFYVLVSRVDVINERHAYIADVGLFLAVGALWAESMRARTHFTQRLVTGAVIAALAALTVVRNREYRSEVALWQSTVRGAPQNPRAWNNLGVAYEHAYDPNAAVAAYMRAVVTEPRYTPARENLDRLSAQMRRR